MELIDGGALFFGLLAPIVGDVLEEFELSVIGRDIDGGRVEEQVFGEAAFVFGDAGEAFELFGIDDGEVEAGLGAVIKEDGVDDLAGGGGEAE